MTAEVDFPKIDGDILFASNANRFACAPRCLNIGSYTFASGAGIQTLGSILIGAGSITNPAQIQIIATSTSWDSDVNLTLKISGLSTNASVSAGSFNGANDNVCWTGQIITGSPFTGLFSLNALHHSTSNDIPNFRASSAAVSNLDTTTDVVIFFSVSGNTTNGKNLQYSAQAFRESMSV